MNDQLNIPKMFTMLIGIPGSGKSTWLKDQHPDSKNVVCPDEIRHWLLNDISDQSQNSTVWNIAIYTLIWNIRKNNPVILDATNVNTVLRMNLLSRLPSCTKKAIIFEVDPDTAIQRVKNDTNYRANVTNDVIYRMYGEFLYTKKVINQENWSEITYI
jgi:predicted kinase